MIKGKKPDRLNLVLSNDQIRPAYRDHCGQPFIRQNIGARLEELMLYDIKYHRKTGLDLRDLLRSVVGPVTFDEIRSLPSTTETGELLVKEP